MTKDIKQVQLSNLRQIARAYFVKARGWKLEDIKNDKVLDYAIKQHGIEATLLRVLLALGSKVLFCEGYLCEHLVTDDGLIMTTNHIQWDLQKETLEEQSEETQIAINKLLTK